MKKTPLYISQLLIVVSCLWGFTPTTTAELQSAVDLWVSDNSSALSTYGEINTWDVSAMTDMSELFKDKTTFNDNISNWNVSSVTNMDNMFKDASSFNQDISGWDVSKVTTMHEMFWECNNFNQDLSSWNVSSVTNMKSMFFSADNFNGDISNWNVSSVTNMLQMFYRTDFAGDISSWDVSSVTNMYNMFANADKFNGDISNWNVSSVTTFNKMFGDASAFNQDISNWDVSSATDMYYMFRGANSFNQDISSWNVSSVTTMDNMFKDASSFNQDISSWNISNVTNFTDIFYGANALSDGNKCAIHTTFSSNGNWPYDWSEYCAVIYGCMDESTCNYNADATADDGSCDSLKFTHNNYDYCQSNLNVLQDFIDNSSNSVGGDSTDHTLSLENDENGDGIIQPLELARQGYNSEWVNGRLEFWNCEDCGLSGNIPESIEQLTYLKNLDLSHNILSGEIPENFGNMSQLTNIDLSHNYLSGYIPDNFIDLIYDIIVQSGDGGFGNEHLDESLAYNNFCEPFSDHLLDVLGWDNNTVHYIQSQECDPMLKIIYPIEGRPRYTGDRSTPVALIVNNFTIPYDGHFHWNIDEDGNDNYSMGSNTPFEVFSLSEGEQHILKIWLVDSSHAPFPNNENMVSDNVNFSIYQPINGCMDDTACNYDENATVDAGNCIYGSYDDYGNWCCSQDLDACGVCGGDSNAPEMYIDYSPNTFFIDDEPYLILYKGSEELDITFSRPLLSKSLEGIYLSSSIGSGFNPDYWHTQISADSSIVDLDILQIASSDILELTIDWNSISFLNCDYSIDSTTVITINTQILGDYDQNNYLEGGDIQILLNYWKDNITTEQFAADTIGEFAADNYNIDLAPVSGDPPHFISSPDGVWSLDDLMAFIRMWNYYNSSDGPAREKNAHTANFGNPVELEIISNQLTMQFPVFDETMSRIWFQLSLSGNETSFDVANFGQQFDINLQTNAGENVHVWDLANLGNGMNLQSLILGELDAQSKKPQELEFQYQVTSMDGLLSSGTMMVEYMPLPDDFELSQAYPNPFNPVTTSHYALPVESDIVISVHDMQGRLVTYLENELKTAGYYKAVWNASNNASGMYFIRMNVYHSEHRLQFSKMQKIILVK